MSNCHFREQERIILFGHVRSDENDPLRGPSYGLSARARAHAGQRSISTWIEASEQLILFPQKKTRREREANTVVAVVVGCSLLLLPGYGKITLLDHCNICKH